MRSHQIAGAYRRVWDSFCRSNTTEDGRHDTEHWRAHTSPYAACVVRVNAADLQPGLGLLRASLDHVAGTRLHPDHFFHIMLQELGFVVDHPAHPDEVSPARLEEFAMAAIEPVSMLLPLTVTLGGANAFHDAVFLEIGGAEIFAQLHARLFELAAIPAIPAFPYLPHCTIAHFDGAASPAEAARVLEPWRTEIFGAFTLAEVEVVTLDPTEPYPHLESYAVIPLGTC
jgi:2'-5' RNA ligase